MNSALMFSKASDEWSTPQPFFDSLAREFRFVLDVAASAENKKCPDYLGLDAADPRRTNALTCPWRSMLDSIEGTWHGVACWMNPPYSRCREFIGKAAAEARLSGVTTVCLVPSRTDTRWWHEDVWDTIHHRCRDGVEVRFVRGRIKFGTTSEQSKNSAPFPSVVIIFRGRP